MQYMYSVDVVSSFFVINQAEVNLSAKIVYLYVTVFLWLQPVIEMKNRACKVAGKLSWNVTVEETFISATTAGQTLDFITDP